MKSPSPIEAFMIDLDFFISTDKNGEETPIVRLRCKTEENNIVIVHAKGFYPYFYVDNLPHTVSTIQNLLAHEKEFSKWIHSSSPLVKYLYYQKQPIFLYKIEGKNPWLILKYSKKLEEKGIKSYENDISFVARFLIDTGLKALNWIRIENYTLISQNNNETIIETDYSNIKNIQKDEENKFNFMILALNILINTIDDEGKKKNFSSVLANGEERIIAASLAWGRNKKGGQYKVFLLKENTDEAEKELITNLFETIHSINPDIIVTFNGNAVIFPYLLLRMNKLNIDPTIISPLSKAKIKKPVAYLGYRIPGYIVYDLVKKTRRVKTKTGKKGFSDIIETILGEERKFNPLELVSLWKKTITNKINSTNLTDSEEIFAEDCKLTFKLFFELEVEEWLTVMSLVGARPSEAIYSTPRHLGEFQLFRILHKNNIVIPPDPSKEEVEARKKLRERGIGGYVIVPRGTLHEAVMICDFTSMFPSIIVSHNIGGESYKGSSLPIEQRFSSEPITALRIMEKELLDKRRVLKREITNIETYLRSFQSAVLKDKLHRLKIISKAIKVIMNSVYGMHNYVGSRFFNTEIANTITALAKEYILKIINWTKEFTNGKCQVIYGDTDSVFIKLSDKKRVFEIFEQSKNNRVFDLQKDLPEGKALLDYYSSKLPEEMTLEFQDLAIRIVFAPETKKRYSYVSAITNEMKITGFEAIRSDTSPFAQEVQKKALFYVLYEGSISKAKRIVIKMCKNLLELEGEALIKKTTIFGPIKRDPMSYKNKTPAIVALEHYATENNENIEELWKKYDYFPYVIIKGTGPITKRARHPSLIQPEDIDKYHYINEAIRDVKRLGIKVTLSDIIMPPTQLTLHELFYPEKTT